MYLPHIAGGMLCLGWQFVQVPLNRSRINYYFRFNTLVLVEYVIFNSSVETLHCQNNSRQFLRFLGNKSSRNKLEPQITFDSVKKCKINNENKFTCDTDISGNI
jgi:hypothetical protein